MHWGGGPYSDTAIDIRAINQVQKFEFRISIKYSGQLGIHSTSDYPYDGFIILYNETTGTSPIGTNVYLTNNIYKGIVNLKFCNGSIDPLRTATIVSGTFEMEAINSEGKVIKITDGRFDLGRF